VFIGSWSILVLRTHVNSAHLFLICLIYAVPTILLIDGLVIRGLVAAVLSGAITLVASTARHGDGDFLLQVIRPIVALAIIPVAWMLFQIFPVKAGLAHPIWESAEQALGHPIMGSISIDPGATMLALCQYLSALALTILAAAAAVDRERSEWILFALVTATALVAVVMIGHDVFGYTFLRESASATDRAQARTCVGLGIIFSTAAAIRIYERRETRRLRPNRSLPLLMRPTQLRNILACAAAFTLCTIALASDLTGKRLFIVAYGLGTMLAVVAIRRIGLGFWGCLAIATTAGVIAIALIAGAASFRATDLTLAFASMESNSLIAATERMSADLPWTGSGAGTFASLASVYQDATDIIRNPAFPTVASKIAVELGRPMLWAIVLTIIVAIAFLLRGALRRGRDSFYPAAGASSLLVLVLLSFCDNGVLGTPVCVCAASITGLAFAQCQSRTVA
jgi:hypothetical protein